MELQGGYRRSAVVMTETVESTWSLRIAAQNRYSSRRIAQSRLLHLIRIAGRVRRALEGTWMQWSRELRATL